MRPTRTPKHIGSRTFRCDEHDVGWIDVPGDSGVLLRDMVHWSRDVRVWIRDRRAGEETSWGPRRAPRGHTVVCDDVRRRV